MDLEETEARSDCAGESQQQFNRPTERVNSCDRLRPVKTRAWEQGTLLGSVNEQRLMKTADWDDLVGAVLNCRACELMTTLWLLVVTTCKLSINKISSPIPVCSHCITWQYMYKYVCVFVFACMYICVGRPALKWPNSVEDDFKAVGLRSCRRKSQDLYQWREILKEYISNWF
jgi:hypothetical protein